MPTKNKKVRQLAGAANLIPPRKTVGWRYAPPEKKTPEWAAISVVLLFWCNFILSRELSSSGTVSEPRRLSAARRTHPDQKNPLHIF